MSKKTKKPAQAKRGTGKKGAKPPSTPAPSASETTPNPEPAGTRFVNDLLVRGEAAKLNSAGKLPQRATHIVQTENEDGSAVVKRARFKLF